MANITMTMGAAAQTAGKSTAKSGSGNMISTFLEMLQSSANTQALNASSKPDKPNKPSQLNKSSKSSQNNRPSGVLSGANKNKIGKPEDDEAEKTGAAGLAYFLEIFGVDKDAAQIISGNTDMLNGGPGNFISQTPAYEITDEGLNLKQILADILAKARTAANNNNAAAGFEFKDLAQLSENGALKAALEAYIAKLESAQTGFDDDIAAKDRAELMTKAIKALDGGRPGAFSADTRQIDLRQEHGTAAIAKSAPAQEIPQTAKLPAAPQVLEMPGTPKMTIEDMINIMRKTASEPAASGPDFTALQKPAQDAAITLSAASQDYLDLTAQAKPPAHGQSNILNIYNINNVNIINDAQGAASISGQAGNQPDSAVITENTQDINANTTDIKNITAKTITEPANAAQDARSPEQPAQGIIDVRNFAQAQSAKAQVQAAQTDIARSADEISRVISNNINNVKAGAEAPKDGFEIKMKLMPKELGELIIKVSYSKGSVALDITAANKTAEAGILSRISELRESLAERGINLADVEIGVNGGNLYHSGQNGAPREGYNGGENNRNNQKSAGYKNGANKLNRLDLNSMAENEAVRREMLMNYMKSKRLLYKTV